MPKAAEPAATAVGTGASRSIGKAIARRLAEDGYRMALVDLLDDVREVAAELADATAYVTDVRDDHAQRQVTSTLPAVLCFFAVITP